MAGLIAKLLGRVRYRRRWRILAAAAVAAADKATMELDHHVRDYGRRHGADQRLRWRGRPRRASLPRRVGEIDYPRKDDGAVQAGSVPLRGAAP
ncbi:hypothetical protein JMJ56_32200 [Belnapia sp. T18]|uniref:Secreted protein n=1 Tax=Belnapia arida TaxID=2804533 RepID=A0ABS1UD81_9PROT|nr:hypothetical protein [Belnapia arida]MBL6082628.1 hypothetical protein [Belnapia arida]